MSMKELVPGLKLSIEEKVTSDNVATAIGSGALDVYSTPSMIALMEKASMLCVDDCINAEQTTVGGLVNIRHVKARPVFCCRTVPPSCPSANRLIPLR